jgi:hypothetical protein
LTLRGQNINYDMMNGFDFLTPLDPHLSKQGYDFQARGMATRFQAILDVYTG